MAEEAADQQGGGGDASKELFTLTEIAEKAGVSMPTAQRYKKSYQDRIPSVGEGRTQRYPEEAAEVFKQIKKENVKRRGRPPKKGSGAKKKSAPKKKTEKKGSDELLTLTKIAEETGISYPTLSRYVKLHKDRIPHEGKGRKRRYHPEAIEVFQEIYAESPRGRKKKKKKQKTTATRKAASGDGALAKRVAALEKSSSDLEKRIKELIKELKKPLKVTIDR